jgi:thiol-disulfide isomerase/thioredoxin
MNLAYFAATLLAVAAPGDLARSGEPRTGRAGILDASSTVLLDFRADWCGPCRQMDSVVGQIISAGFPIRRVNVDQERDLATRFNVSGIPCFVMLVNGREVDRVVGVTDRGRLEAMFNRNGVAPGMNAARSQSPDTRMSSSSQPVPFPPSDPNQYLNTRAAPRANSPGGADGVTDDGLRGNSNSIGSQFDPLVRASVRLRIEDDRGNSVGSGTIIDSRSGEALIITCGHVFRDAAKGGHIWVDLFGPGAPQGVLGKLIDFDLNAEIGLISIRTSYPVTVAHLAPAGYVVRNGDSVISVGCDGGADATPRQTHVTSINRYMGTPNLQVAFQPQQGRSGGGLFTPDGLVVGICYAADREDNEGLFTALPALQKVLDREGLEFVYREGSGLKNQASGQGTFPAAGMTDSNSIAAAPNRLSPAADRSMPAITETAITPTSATSHLQPGDQLTPDEQSAVDVLREKAKNSEVICIFRPLNDPQAKSDIIVLDHASPALIRQLTGLPQANSSRQLTSMATSRGDNHDVPVNAADAQAPRAGSSWPDVIRR